MLLRSSCCYVEDVVTLKMLLRWRCCYVNMLSAFYIHRNPSLQSALEALKFYRHKVNGACAPTNAFKTALWMWREKRLMCISPMALWVDYDILCLSKETWNSNKNTQFLWEKQTWYKLMNLTKTKKHWNSGQHIPDMLSACGTNSRYSHVVGRTRNTAKHGEKWHLSNWNTMNFNCLPGNPPASALYIYICCVYIYVYIYIIHIYICMAIPYGLISNFLLLQSPMISIWCIPI